MNPYAANKALMHTDRLRILKEGGQPNPVHVFIVLSDLCNQNCNFCAYRQSDYQASQMFGLSDDKGGIIKNPNRMIPTTKVIEILEDAVHMKVKSIQFTGGGEPTVHRDCAHIIQFTNALGLETSLVTNGVLLDKKMRDVLMRSTWVRISLDAGTKESYMFVRGIKSADSFRNVQDNISALVQQRNKTPLSQLHIGIGFVITRDNWREIPVAVKIAKDLGADSIRLTVAFTGQTDDYYAEFGTEAEKLCKEAEDLSHKDFIVVNNFNERLKDLYIKSPEYDRCVYQHFMTFIGADLNVYVCCTNSYNRRGLVGSLKYQGFSDLWQSVEKRNFMEKFNARECPVCQFNDKNRAMNTLMDAIPMLHCNFP